MFKKDKQTTTTTHQEREGDQVDDDGDQVQEEEEEEEEEIPSWKTGALVVFKGNDLDGNPRCWQRVLTNNWNLEKLTSLIRIKTRISEKEGLQMRQLKEGGHAELDDEDDIKALNTKIRAAAELDLILTIEFTILPASSPSSTSSSSSSDVSNLLPHQTPLSTVEGKQEPAANQDEASSKPSNGTEPAPLAAAHKSTPPSTSTRLSNSLVKPSSSQQLASSSKPAPGPTPSTSIAPPPPRRRSSTASIASSSSIKLTASTTPAQPAHEHKRKLSSLDAGPSDEPSSAASLSKRPEADPQPASSSTQRRSSSSTTSSVWVEVPSPPSPQPKEQKKTAPVVQHAQSEKEEMKEEDQLDSSQYREDSHPPYVGATGAKKRKRRGGGGEEEGEGEKKKKKKKTDKGKGRDATKESSGSVAAAAGEVRAGGGSRKSSMGEEKEEQEGERRRLTRSEKGKGKEGNPSGQAPAAAKAGEGSRTDDTKTQLLDLVSRLGLGVPSFKSRTRRDASGVDAFVEKVVVGEHSEKGTGWTKEAAEQKACRKMLDSGKLKGWRELSEREGS